VAYPPGRGYGAGMMTGNENPAGGDAAGPREGAVPFGHRNVDASEKPRLVRGVFESVAGRYDLMNDLMSLGLHRLWKSTLVEMLNPRPGMHLLDVAGGTGDIAARFLDAGGGHVTLCDLTEPMVRHGRARMVDSGRLDGVDWVVGNAEALPLPESAVDACTIGFGLRNVTRISAALGEMRRVLRPGGRFLCLEFSHVVLPLLDRLYDRYSDAVLPRLGAWVGGDRAAYVYLVESIRRFPNQQALEALMRDAGFARVTHRNLAGGIVAIHSGWRT